MNESAKSVKAEAPLAKIVFRVPNPVSINRTYGRGKITPGRRGLFIRSKVGAFKRRVATRAAIAICECKAWPRNPWQVRRVVVGYNLYNVRLDTDAPRKLIRDAMEHTAYAKDAGNVVADGPSPWVINNGGPPEVEIWVELYETCSPIEAESLYQKHLQNKASYASRKAKKAAKVRGFTPQGEGKDCSIPPQFSERSRHGISHTDLERFLASSRRQ